MIGQSANHHAANAAFTNYLSHKATNTIRAQRFDLVTFAIIAISLTTIAFSCSLANSVSAIQTPIEAPQGVRTAVPLLHASSRGPEPHHVSQRAL